MDKEQIDSYLLAGKINFEALELGSKLIKPGASMISVLDQIEAFIKSKGAELAFPAQISLNSTAAHFCPAADDVILNENDVVKLDVGVCVNGYIADAARTFDLSRNGANKELIAASRSALNNALKLIRPGVPIGDIGKEIHETIKAAGFTPIRNLSGHGLGKYMIHSPPSIPNVETGIQSMLRENQVIAIEPFATNGAGLVYEGGTATVFSLVEEKPVRSPIAKQILGDIKKFNGLPFTTRWFIPKYGVASTQLALRDLKALGIISSHPPLIEKQKGLVAQFEHSVIVKEKPIVYTRLD